MKTRIKYFKKNNYWYYAVQTKKWIFWNTIKLCSTWFEVERFFKDIEKIDNFNSKAKTLNKIVYNGWAVRNTYKNIGISNTLNFFESNPSKCKSDDKSETIWVDINDNRIPLMEIKTKKLFGKECLEPMKLRITIEQMEG